MGGAPTIVWLRPGVGYIAAAAASMRRLERAIGREHDCNSSYRDYDEQMRMYNAWQRYVNSGYDPRYKPNHSRALHPDDSEHCAGVADDSDDWTDPAYVEEAAEHGWIRTAAWDPTEQHHFTYQWWMDQHRNDPDPEEDDMYNDDDRITANKILSKLEQEVVPTLVVVRQGVDGTIERVDQSVLPTLTIMRGVSAGVASDLTALGDHLRELLSDDQRAELATQLSA